MRAETLYQIHTLTHRMRTFRERALAGTKESLPMPIGQGRILHALWHNPGIAQGQLAELLNIRPASLSELLRKLEKNGWIRRDKDENDHRIVRIHMTETGRAFFTEHRGKHERIIEVLFSSLTDEELCDLLALQQKVMKSWEDNLEKARAISEKE